MTDIRQQHEDAALAIACRKCSVPAGAYCHGLDECRHCGAKSSIPNYLCLVRLTEAGVHHFARTDRADDPTDDGCVLMVVSPSDPRALPPKEAADVLLAMKPAKLYGDWT